MQRGKLSCAPLTIVRLQPSFLAAYSLAEAFNSVFPEKLVVFIHARPHPIAPALISNAARA